MEEKAKDICLLLYRYLLIILNRRKDEIGTIRPLSMPYLQILEAVFETVLELSMMYRRPWKSPLRQKVASEIGCIQSRNPTERKPHRGAPPGLIRT